MANTLTLEFSDSINIDQLLGTARPISPGDRAIMEEKFGIDVAAFEAGRRIMKVQVSDLLAQLLLGQLRIALTTEGNTQAQLYDVDDEPYLAVAVRYSDEEYTRREG